MRWALCSEPLGVFRLGQSGRMFTRVQLIAFCLLLTATCDRAAAASLVAAAESRIGIASDLAGLRLLPTRRLLTSDTDTSAPEAASEESVPEEQLPFESEVDYDDYEADEDSEEDSTDVEDCDLEQENVDLYVCCQLCLL